MYLSFHQKPRSCLTSSPFSDHICPAPGRLVTTTYHQTNPPECTPLFRLDPGERDTVSERDRHLFLSLQYSPLFLFFLLYLCRSVYALIFGVWRLLIAETAGCCHDHAVLTAQPHPNCTHSLYYLHPSLTPTPTHTYTHTNDTSIFPVCSSNCF